MLVSTYQHDYIKPVTGRYRFSPGSASATQPVRSDCECTEKSNVEIPIAVLDQCDIPKGDVEWTGIAPMGKMVDPRIIPTKMSDAQIEAFASPEGGAQDCFVAQPNRFLRILRNVYPDLYNRLKEMPKEDLKRRLEKQRNYSTYQIDFCGLNEYAEGLYENAGGKDSSKVSSAIDPANKLLHPQAACAEFRAQVQQQLSNDEANPGMSTSDPCESSRKPVKISFADSSRFISSGSNSHWGAGDNLFGKKTLFTEYMDTINKNGCVIMRNHIHDHHRCGGGRHCRHWLTHNCPFLR